METQNIKQFGENREERAELILQNGDPVQTDEFTYLVPSQFDSNKCNINVNGNRWETMLLNSIKLNNSLNLTGEEKMAITP